MKVRVQMSKKSNQHRVALVTGASSGIGYFTAIELSKAGFTVYGCARREEALERLEEKGIRTLKLDVTDEASMVQCVSTIMSEEGSIDILVNNAGYGSYGAVEDVSIEEAKRQMEVNIFGLARMTQLVLPGMRDKAFGKIVNISSMGGKMYTPFGAWYHATKHALEGFSDCLRLEVAPFGIDVILIEPGGIKTDWGIIAADNLVKTSKDGPYEGAAMKTAHNMKQLYSGENLTKPVTIAKVIVKAILAKKPRTRYLVGYSAKPAVTIRQMVPDRLFDRIIGKFV